MLHSLGEVRKDDPQKIEKMKHIFSNLHATKTVIIPCRHMYLKLGGNELLAPIKL